MNVHHLELYYYVARHGGISEAVRNIPYGIQQPAVSVQILQLEEYLGTKLFQRRPFQLTPAGEKLYQFIQPFFSNLEKVSDDIRGNASQVLRIGASTTILRLHFPEMLRNLRGKISGLKISLHDGVEPQLLALLEKLEIDIAVTVMPARIPADTNSQPLIKLPLVLLVPTESKIKSAAELWKRDKIEDPLICLPPIETITRSFQQHLGKLGVDWYGSITVNSLDLIETYVANGFGIGLSIAVPGTKKIAGVRVLALDDFPPILVGALWKGTLTPVLQAFLTELHSRANSVVSTSPGWEGSLLTKKTGDA